MTQAQPLGTAEVKPTAIIKKSLSYIQEPIFSERQLILLLQKTPPSHIKTRQGRGGKTFRYATVSYVTLRLNQIFGWSWSFEVKSHSIDPGGKSVTVEGRLSVLSPVDGRVLVSKEQFGGADLKYASGTDRLVDFADDLKAATSDALKKCASMLGIAADLYADPETADEIEAKVNMVTQVQKATKLAQEAQNANHK